VKLRRVLGSGVATAVLFPVSSRAQGAAESVLTNALSSSTTAKAGSALNHALSQSTTQLGLRIQERTASPVRVGVSQGVPRTAVTSATAGNLSRAAIRTGSLPALGGISVQGGETACTSVRPPNPASPASPTPANTVLAESMPRTAHASVDCHGRNSAGDSGAGDRYKSFVTLPFPK